MAKHKKWMISESQYVEDHILADGNKFFTGNGYLGIRGMLQEYEKKEYIAVNLSGIYDQTGEGWREPVNAPNGLFAYLMIDNEAYRLPERPAVKHVLTLDYEHAALMRETIWSTPKGNIIVKAKQFPSLVDPHLICLEYEVELEFDAELQLITGIDADVWDINGPHFKKVVLEEKYGILRATAITQEKNAVVAVSEITECNFTPMEITSLETKRILRELHIDAKRNQCYHISKYIGIVKSIDLPEHEISTDESDNPDTILLHTKQAADAVVQKASKSGMLKLETEHRQAWEEKWKYSRIEIDGDEEAELALNYSIYHLHCIAPRYSKSMSIPARGLSGQTYKGAIFWDTEMFMLDFFLFTEPEVAKTLLKYRVDTLEGAKKKARQYGFEGAFYAWESQEGGYDACSDYNVTDVFTGRPMRTYFKDKQVHISSAIVHGLVKYNIVTGDDSIYEEGGYETVFECARFYLSLLVKQVFRDVYEIHDVIGPDEYHERVNNNAYTNRMAKYTFEAAVSLIEKLEYQDALRYQKLDKEYMLPIFKEQLKDALLHLYIPKPDQTTKVIEQFDGYYKLEDTTPKFLKTRLLDEKEYWGGAYGIASHTKVIKQADVVTMLNFFSAEYSSEELLANWDYYEPRTEHGSSLSACMYALLACRCDRQERAYPHFIKSARADLEGGSKQWAGLIYIGGTHPAAAGGAYMNTVEGFGGVSFEEGKFTVTPHLPTHWKKLTMYVMYQKERYQITIQGKKAFVIKEG